MALTRITQGVIKPNQNYDTHNINSTGIITATGANISGNMSVGGVLTYEDVTNIDSVGLITARKGIISSGVVTATSFVGDGSNLTGLASDKIEEGNTKAEVIDTGSDGRFVVTTEGSERFSIDSTGDFKFESCNDSYFSATGALTIDYKEGTTTRIRNITKWDAFYLYPMNDNYPVVIGSQYDTQKISFYKTGEAIIGTGITLSGSTGNIIASGIITARTGVVFQGNATFGNNIKSVYNSNLEIYNDGNNRFKASSGGIQFGQPGSFLIGNGSFANTRFEATGTHAILYSAGTKVARSHEARFEVGNPDVGVGIAATITTSGDARFAGIITATNFAKADGSSIGGAGTGEAFVILRNSSNPPALSDTGRNIIIGVGAAHKYGNGSASGGNENLFAGYNAGYTQTAGDGNVFLGAVAGYSNATSGGNTYIGHEAGRFATGANNVILGRYAGNVGGFTGSNNIVIGASADPSSAGISNEITLGDANITNFRVPGVHIGITANAASLPAAIFRPGVIQETYFNDTGGGIQSNHTHDILTYGMVWNGVTNAAGSWTFNIRGDASTTFNSLTSTGKVTTMTMYSANNSTSNYMTAFKIDGTTQTVKWAGGSAPSEATGSGVDVYSMTIMKTGSNTYHVFGNVTNFA